GARRESNPRPLLPQSSALTPELQAPSTRLAVFIWLGYYKLDHLKEKLQMWQSFKSTKIWFWLVCSWFVCGALATLAGFTGLFYPLLSVLLLLPICLIVLLLSSVFGTFSSFSKKEQIVVSLIILWWLLHSLQVFVPETGFDALWYHLPLAQQTVINHRFIGTTEFYQSFNPQFSDSIFYIGFAIAGETGAKIIAYLFGISLVFTSYILSRQYLSRPSAFLITLLVSSFQVVSWQSSSFYIDIAKAFWELSALVLLLQKNSSAIPGGLAFGASLASKLFSILLLPLYIGLGWLEKGKRYALNLVIISILVAVPFYLFAYFVSGNPFYSAFHHLETVQEIGSTAPPIFYIFNRLLIFPLAFVEMVKTREYTTPLLVLVFPLILIFRKVILKNKTLLYLTIFTLYQLVIWWLVPPTSTRYALSGFITATVLTVLLLEKWLKDAKKKQLLFYSLLIVGILALPIRIGVALRSWEYISGQQTKSEYLEQFIDGNIDSVLKKWHQLD
ncbi:MAG: hypothetical protein QG639_686, partial [Patescibacteria group bacterium]|nr:hypothetical protein [Patescibacteria group bacterium]